MSDSDALETSAGGSVSDGSDAAAGVGLAPPRRLRSYRMKEDFGDQGRRRSAALERKRAHRNALTAYTRRLALAEEDLTGESFGDLGEADDDGGDWGYADDQAGKLPMSRTGKTSGVWNGVEFVYRNNPISCVSRTLSLTSPFLPFSFSPLAPPCCCRRGAGR